MKKVIYLVLISFFIISCTKFNEDIAIDVQDYRSVTHLTINTPLRVFNLVVDQAEFDEMYLDFEEDIEIEGFLNLYKNNELIIDNELVELEIKGKTSSKFALKTLGVKFDNSYHNEERTLIDVETLPFHTLDRIKAFRLRNSGNDFEETMVKDISYTKLAIDGGLNIDLTYAEQSVVFINGAFLGIMNIRTEANTNGISRLYDEDKDDITLAKINAGGTLEIKDGDEDKVNRLITAIDAGDYDYLNQEIDIDNFIDYMIFESMVGNTDWPKNNVRFFAIKDGPFRFIMFDLDLAAIKTLDADIIEIINNPVTNPITNLFNVFYKNETFKSKFDERFEFIKSTGVMSPVNFNKNVTEYKENIEHVMPTHINKYKIPDTFTKWYFNLEKLKNNFSDRIGNI